MIDSYMKNVCSEWHDIDYLSSINSCKCDSITCVRVMTSQQSKYSYDIPSKESLKLLLWVQSCDLFDIDLSVKIYDGGRFNCCMVVDSCAKMNVSFHIDLLGKSSASDIKSFCYCHDTNSASWNISNIHHNNDTISSVVVKNIIDDTARVTFNGDITLLEQSSGSDAKQRCDNILLSDFAKATTCPNLTILNNDISCSHGATVGTFDKSSMVYMTSRGIPEKTCQSLLMEGMLADIVME